MGAAMILVRTLTSTVFVLAIAKLASAHMKLDDRVCHVEHCYVCTEKDARCSTPTLDESFFGALHSSIKYMLLRFNPPGLSRQELGKDALWRFNQLEKLQLFGDFSAIAPGGFDHLVNLRSLAIIDCSLKNLPANLFKHCSSLKSLKIRNTHLDFLPFDALGNVQYGFNLKIVYDRPTLMNISCEDGDQAKLPWKHNELYSNITRLSLIGLKFQTTNCTGFSLSPNFFEPFQSLVNLNISNSNFFVNHSTLLQHLPKLDTVIADSVEPFTHCPAAAVPFFQTLPRTLKSAILTGWDTQHSINQSCVFSRDILAPLGHLNNLENLNLRFTYNSFGRELDAAIFPTMSSLTKLDLGFAGITRIYNLSRFKFPQLKVLKLDGNPLGSQHISILADQDGRHTVNSTVSHLDLAESIIWSTPRVDYNLAPTLNGFPHIVFVNLSQNYLERPPIYDSQDSPNHPKGLSTLLMDENSIADTGTLSNDLDNSLCSQFPNLTEISVSYNFLYQLDGMCKQVRDLNVRSNFLMNDTITLNVLKTLVNLEKLDMSQNWFMAPSGMLDELVKLKEIDMSGNNIYELPDDFFRNNLQLTNVNLASNRISTIRVEIFGHLKKLKYLSLKDNRISIFPYSLTRHIDKLGSLEYVYIGDNPFDCRCQHSYFQDWIKATKKIPTENLRFLRCSTPVLKMGKYVLKYVDDFFECKVKEPLTVVGSIFAAIIVTALLALPCYKYSWYIKHMRVVCRAIKENLRNIRQEHICEYDTYVSYNREDEEDSLWVANHLISVVEQQQMDLTKPQLKLYVEGRDAGCGTQKFTEKAKILKKCNKILIVVSNSYLKSTYCLGEADLSGCEMYGTDFYQPNRVLVLVREELTEEIIKPPMTALLIGNVIQVNHSNERRMRAAWKNIRSFVASRYVYHKKKAQGSRHRKLSRKNKGAPSVHVVLEQV